jgi:hypothetical protein
MAQLATQNTDVVSKAAVLGTAAPKLGQTPPSSGMSGAFGQVSAGPAAIAMMALYQAMSVYEQLMVLEQKQTLTEIDVAGVSACAAKDAAIDAANAQADATRTQAIGSFVNAGVTGLQMGATAYGTAGKYDEAAKFGAEVSEYEGNRTTLLAKMNGEGTADVTVGEGEERDPDMQQRINSLTTKGRLQAGDYDESAPKGKSDATEEAVAHMTPEERQQFLETLNEKQSTASRNQNNAFSELQVASQKWQNIGSIVNNGTNGITGCVQAQYQQNQGAAQGAQSLASTNSQMAQNMLSNTSQGIGKFYDMQLQDLQLLQQIAANSQVRS